MRHARPAMLTVAACLAAPLAAQEGLLLARDGAPRAVVVTAGQPAPCVERAVAEFREHITLISGAELPVAQVGEGDSLDAVAQGRDVVLIGDSPPARAMGVDTAGLPPDGFIIRSAPGRLVIAGKDAAQFSVNYDWVPASAGTLYGVYRVLEELGVRWFYPGPEGTVLPRAATLEAPALDLRDAPYFPYRFGGYGRDLMPWHRRIGYGGDRDPWSTRHTFNQTVPFHRKYAQQHPEYFVVGRDDAPGANIALGHPEVIPAIVAEAREFFASDRPEGKKSFLVIPADGWGHCHCERCLPRLDFEADPRGMMSNIVAEAAVAVAEAVRGDHPAGRVVYCAYSNYYLPPTTVERFPDNLDLLIAQPRAGFHDQARRAEAEQVLRDWLKLRPPEVYFCRYYGNLQTLAPSFMPGVIARDIRMMKQVNEHSAALVGGEMNFTALPADSPHAWWHHLNSYLTAKLLWNPDADLDALLDDYCAHFYGPAAQVMRRFWDRCAELYLDDRTREIWPVQVIDEMQERLGRAAQATRGTEYEARVRFIDRGFENLRMMRARLLSADEDTGDPDAGLVRHFPLDELLDGTPPVTPEAVTGRDAPVAGATLVDGVRGGALRFSGEGSGVRMQPLSLADTDYTLAAWVRPDEPLFSGTHYVIGPHAYDRHCLKIEGGRLWLWHRTADGSWDGQRLSCAAPVQGFIPGRWHHLVGTFSQRSGMALYIDGQLRGLDTTKTEPSVHPVANIAASGIHELEGCFPGAVDEVRVYRRELSAAEVRRLFEERR